MNFGKELCNGIILCKGIICTLMKRNYFKECEVAFDF